MPHNRIILVTGLSGSGKTIAIHAIEDLGYFCIDNMPLALLPKLIELMGSGAEVHGLALVADTREPGFPGNEIEIFDQLKNLGYEIEILFLEASDQSLLRRYGESRRTHPKANGGSVLDGIQVERKLLRNLRERATFILDTSDLTVHDLRNLLQQRYKTAIEGPKLNIFIISFGFKHGIPQDADLVFDVRFLSNPYFIDHLRNKTGLDSEVASYVFSDANSNQFLSKLDDLLKFLIPNFEKEGKHYLTVAIGCTGGRHRSVTISEHLAKELTSEGFRVSVRHRDIEKG